ncbi:ABC transporter, transmembrane domain, type 1 [Cordyceps fumosorosea ARSEF 2679]|uniref:ABC transporter, transmembrane domain, type 1 n=1 Tax=Cordyceps fumosorosea (strain ARSEF 2679) TaxID=1081104 RepID=A0A167NCD8_CORFA|nr:ABC transporter, transmembrane domain, type 1 [Cordyceps fumosorosea ARSEF 2679]OAA55388.1 ABC transporter, transmembrane domain, type 1 [Cordyceps fumosorosea ARSEF 2679]
MAQEPEKNGRSLPPDEKHGDDKTPATNQLRPQREATFSDYLRVFKYATKWDLVAYALGSLASIGAGCTLPLLNVVFGRFTTQFTNFAGAGTLSPETFKSNLQTLSLYMLGLFLGRLFLNYVNKFAFRMIGIRISSAVRLHFLQALFAQSIHVFDSMPPGFATNTITTTSNTLQLGISEKLGTFIEFNATIVAAVVVAFIYSWRLTLVTSSALVFIMLTIGVLLPIIVKGQGRTTKLESQSNSIASETFGSIRMIMACGAEMRIAEKYAAVIEDSRKNAQRTSPFIALQFGLVFFGVFAAFSLSFWYGSKSFLEGTLTDVGTIIVVLFSMMMLLFSMERISTPMLAVSKATVAACQFFTVIDAPRPDPGHLVAPDVTADQDIILQNVTFAYPSRPHVKVLDDLSLHFESGKTTAIVGPSGSGKSTIVGLIERWYSLKEQYVVAKAVEKKKKKKNDSEEDEPTEEEAAAAQAETDAQSGPPITLSGSVTTCGHSIDDINVKWWRSQIGLVQQEPFLFNESIYVNVCNGLVGTQWEDEPEDKKREMVKAACKEAFADEFIDKLPQGYDTTVGDGGARLSGGQRQRIAIARSIVRQPKILIFDEATSAIDVRGEKIVQAALDRVAQNRRTITIAHRLSTIKKADTIVVLKKGRVVETGTHESLLDMTDGVYAGLVRAQALSLGEATDAGDGVRPEETEDAVAAELAREKSKAGESTKGTNLESTTTSDKTRGFFNSFGRLFYETRSHWPIMALTLVAAACAGAAIPIQAWLFAKVIVVFGYASDRTRFRHDSELYALMWLVLAIGVGCAYTATFFLAARTANVVRAKYQREYFLSILYQKPAFFDEDDHAQGAMTARASGDPQKLEELMGANMASVYIGLFTLVGSIIIAFCFAWKLAIVSLCVVVPVLLASTYWRFRYEIEFEKMNDAVFTESSKFAAESIGAFRTVASLTLEDAICARFGRLCRGHVVEAYKKARWVSLLFAFSDSATMACQALIFYYGGRLLLSGEYGLTSFFVCFLAVMNAGESTGQALSFGPNATQVKDAANRILRLRDSRNRDSGSDVIARRGSGDHGERDGGVKIEFENVHFQYPTRDTPVFSGLNLTIEKGHFAALVGASGCGKTSIISLLERAAFSATARTSPRATSTPTAKTCPLSPKKRPSSEASPKTHQPQYYPFILTRLSFLSPGTIRENILLGVDEATVTDEQLHNACRAAEVHDFIVSLPEGYATSTGSRGVALSGGQKQRVAIARALVRAPRVLLLDEATSSLDSESERLVQAAFERAGRGRTMVVVAHRLATVQNADVIFVLGEGGRLLERGSHGELLRRRGVYWQMCQSQALDR